LVELAKSLGVEFYFETQVEEIILENGKVKGIITVARSGTSRSVEQSDLASRSITSSYIRAFDYVVSNMDITHTYRKLLPHAKHPDFLLNQPKSSSGVIFYWGIKQQFPQLDLHNILFSENYREEFKTMFEDKTIYHDPTVYINITSKHKPDDAPEGFENWFVLINAPVNEGQDWDKIIAETKQNVIQKIKRTLGVDISELIECESILDPRTIESKTSSAQGALYGNSSNNRYAAFLRHANFSSKIKNLYFVGGSVHPGGGIPLALSSAKIMSGFL
jgi:phytoene dehydrogenase-like protein